MTKDSVIILLGPPLRIESKTENGQLIESLGYTIPKSDDSSVRIVKLHESFKAGLLDLSTYRNVLQLLSCQLSLRFEDNILVGYKMD